MLRCRRPGPSASITPVTWDMGLQKSDLHNLSFWSHHCCVGFLWWKASSSASPRKLLSDGRNKSQENSCIKAAEASCYGNFREYLLLWPGFKSCLIHMQWQLGKTSTESLVWIFSCLTGLFSSRHYRFPVDWRSLCFSMCDNSFYDPQGSLAPRLQCAADRSCSISYPRSRNCACRVSTL